MNAIIDPTDPTFDMSFLSIAPPKPVASSHGMYFAKLSYRNGPLYIQPPACQMKSGLVLSSKKMQGDLMFSRDQESFYTWLEQLEQHIIQLLYKNRDKWFEIPLELHDIENSMIPPYKSYRSGKFYLVRCYSACPLGKCHLKVFDDQENELTLDALKENTPVATILEIQGVRCSSRTFHLELEWKQIMVMNPHHQQLFGKCLLQQATTVSHSLPTTTEPLLIKVQEPEDDLFRLEKELTTATTSLVIQDVVPTSQQPAVTEDMPPPDESNNNREESLDVEELPQELKPNSEPDLIPLDDLEIQDDTPVSIKDKNAIYYEMYRAAKKRAKEAREAALMTYLEACKIKNMYMLEDSDNETII